MSWRTWSTPTTRPTSGRWSIAIPGPSGLRGFLIAKDLDPG